jgi:uncharacterized protein (TIGR02246 family)
VHSRILVTVSLFTLMGLGACSPGLSQSARPPAAAEKLAHDDAPVRATLDSLVLAWNRHDIDALQPLLTEDVQWIVSNGNCWRNRQSVCEAYRILHAAIQGSSEPNPLATLSIENIEVQFLSPRVAIGMATLRFGGALRASTAGPQVPSTRASFVMDFTGLRWQIAQFHQTVLEPRIEQEDPVWGNTEPSSGS